jgi:hypothetical protein
MANPNEKPQQRPQDPYPKQPDGKVFTFIDRGAHPVRKVSILKKQDFHLGKATTVTDPDVLKMVTGHPCFVEGEVDADELLAKQATAEGEEARKRQRDAKINAAEKARNAKFAAKDDKED